MSLPILEVLLDLQDEQVEEIQVTLVGLDMANMPRVISLTPDGECSLRELCDALEVELDVTGD